MAAAPAVLVVDDDARLAELARRTLEGIGFSVVVARSAAAGVALAARQPFAVVLTDFSMPGGDGLTVVRALHSLQPAARCVLWSAALPDSVARAGRALGATVAAKVVGEELRALVRGAAELAVSQPSGRAPSWGRAAG